MTNRVCGSAVTEVYRPFIGSADCSTRCRSRDPLTRKSPFSVDNGEEVVKAVFTGRDRRMPRPAQRSEYSSTGLTTERILSRSSAILLATCAAWIAWSPLAAEPTGTPDEPQGLEAVPEPLDIPPRVQSGETLEPEITIRRDERQTITEYRINGRVHSIKVEPVVGPTYWLVDTTGDGFTDTRYDGLLPPFAIPGWVLFRW